MKTSLLCIILTLFLFSCSVEPDFETTAYQSNANENDKVEKDHSTSAVNPFDAEGKRIYETLQLYYQNHGVPNSVAELARQIRYITERNFRDINMTARLIPFTDEMVQSIMEDPDNSMILIVQNSMLQTYAKENLISFLQNLITKRQEEFNIVCSYISDYETQVLEDTTFTTEEIQTLLTVSSISKYSLYSEQERKDKDWDILNGNKPARPFFGKNEVPVVFIVALLDQLI